MSHRLLQLPARRWLHKLTPLLRRSSSASTFLPPHLRSPPPLASQSRLSVPIAIRHVSLRSSSHSDPVPPNTFAQYLDLLRADVDRSRRVHGATLSAALDQARFSRTGRDCSIGDALFLLQCCSMLPEKPRPEKLALIELAWPLVLRGGAAASGVDVEDAATAMTDKTVQPSAEHLVALLREYRTNMKKLNFEEFGTRYEKAIRAGGLTVYVPLLYLAAEIADEAAMVRILRDIRDAPLAPSADVFNALVLGHSRCHELGKCEEVVERMRDAGIEPTPRTWKELIRAYIENRAPDRAEQMLAERGAELSVPQVLSVIRTAIRRDDQSQVLRMAFERLPEEILGNRHIIPEIRNACVELIQANEARKAFRIIEQLPVPRFSEHEDSDGYATFFISELIRSGTPPDEVTEMSRKLVDSGRNSRALHVCCEVALRNGSADSLRYLQELARVDELRATYFWPLLVREHLGAGETGVLQVLAEMQTLGVAVDADTLVQYVLPRLPITLGGNSGSGGGGGGSGSVVSGCKELEARGVPVAGLMAPLLGWLVQQGRLRDGCDVLREWSATVSAAAMLWPLVNWSRNVRNHGVAELSALATILAELAAAGQRRGAAEVDLAGQMMVELIGNPSKRVPLEVVIRMLQQFRAHEVRISQFAGDLVAQYVQKCGGDGEQEKRVADALEVLCDRKLNAGRLEQGDDYIKHPRDMTLEELECHLVELQEKGANTRGVLRRLLQFNVRAGKLERAAEVHAACLAQSVSLSAGMVAATLELHVRTGQLPAAEATLRQLGELFPAFTIDEHKIVDMAALLVQHQKIQTAKELLRKRSQSQAIRGGPGIQKNIWQLLTNLALATTDPQQPAQARPMFEFLQQLGYCEPANSLLGPQIRECLHKGQLRTAVEEFLDASRVHRRTPLLFELLAQLVAATNASQSAANLWPQPMAPPEAKEQLQLVSEAATRVHGPVSTNVALVVAFAHSGTEAQVRKILIDPAVRVHMPAILKQCEFLCESGAMEPLLRLAKCSRGLSGEVKEADFYALLMAQYVKQNDVGAAMGLFERLVADDEFKVTAELGRALVALLERNNLEVPSSVAVYVRR